MHSTIKNLNIILVQAQAAWKTVADAAEKTKGMTRFKAAWAAEGDKALITEIVAGPEEYLSFIGELDVPYLLKTIKFEKFFIQGTKEQIEKLGNRFCTILQILKFSKD